MPGNNGRGGGDSVGSPSVYFISQCYETLLPSLTLELLFHVSRLRARSLWNGDGSGGISNADSRNITPSIPSLSPSLSLYLPLPLAPSFSLPLSLPQLQELYRMSNKMRRSDCTTYLTDRSTPGWSVGRSDTPRPDGKRNMSICREDFHVGWLDREKKGEYLRIDVMPLFPIVFVHVCIKVCVFCMYGILIKTYKV